MLRKYFLLFCAIVLSFSLVSVPFVMGAPAIRFDPRVKAALDKLSNPVPSTALYQEAIDLQSRQDDTDVKTVRQRETNEQELLVVRKRIKLVDAAKLIALEANVKETKQRYQPLFDEYKQANDRAAAAKYVPVKELKAALRLQVDLLRPAVQAAKQDIKLKETKLKSAKEASARTVKKIRDTLDDAAPLQARIRAEKAAAAVPARHLSSAWSAFHSALKKANARHVADTLRDVVGLLKQVHSRKQAILELERRVGAIVAKAKAMTAETN